MTWKKAAKIFAPFMILGAPLLYLKPKLLEEKPPSQISAPASTVVREVKLKPLSKPVEKFTRDRAFESKFTYSLTEHPEDLHVHIADYRNDSKEEYIKQLFLEHAGKLTVARIDAIHTGDENNTFHDAVRSLTSQEYDKFCKKLPDDIAREYVKAMHAHSELPKLAHDFPTDYGEFKAKLYDTYFGDGVYLNFKKANALVREISSSKQVYGAKIAQIAALIKRVTDNVTGFDTRKEANAHSKRLTGFKVEVRKAQQAIKKTHGIDLNTYIPATLEILKRAKTQIAPPSEDDETESDSHYE